MAKEAGLVLQELLAKITARERFIGIGAIVIAVGWLFGALLATVNYGLGLSSNVFLDGGGSSLGILAVIAAVAAVAVIYLRHAPNVNIQWPAPAELVQLIVAAVAALAALLLLLSTLQDSSNFGKLRQFAGDLAPSWPITDWLAVLAIAVGAGLMVYGAYLDWAPAKPGMELLQRLQNQNTQNQQQVPPTPPTTPPNQPPTV